MQTALDNHKNRLPCDLHAEMAILCAILLDPSCMKVAAPLIEPADFFRKGNGEIYAAMRDIYGKGGDIDTVTVIRRVKEMYEWAREGNAPVASYLSSCMDTGAMPDNIRHYIESVKYKKAERKILEECQTIIRNITEGRYSAPEAIKDAQRRINEIQASREDSNRSQPIHEIMRSAVEEIKATASGEITPNRVNLGIASLDAMIGGLNPDDLCVIAARPGVGKTVFATQMAWNLSYLQSPENPVVFFSLEMGKKQVATRLISHISGISHWKLRNTLVSAAARDGASDFELLDRSVECATAAKFQLRDLPESVSSMCEEIERILDDGIGLRCIFIDYLLLLKPERGRTRREEVTDNIYKLKELAKTYKMPVVALSQLSRECDMRRPVLSDLTESAAIEHTADQVITLWRDPSLQSGDERPIECSVLKSRHGLSGVTDLIFEADYMRFREAS